ncbi:MAG: thermopsin family protease [Nitrososphaerales archaeon]
MKIFSIIAILVAALFSLSFLGSVLPVAAQQPVISFQQYVPSRFIGFYTCSATSPCPMGVADYGVNGATTYSYTAESFVSWANFTTLNIGLSTRSSGDHKMTIQQNLVDYNVFENGNNGQYWAQAVPLISQLSTGKYKIQLLDNIWNFSAPFASSFGGYNNENMSAVIYGNLLGNCKHGGGAPVFYYCFGNITTKVKLPFEIQMVTQTTILGSGPHAGSSAILFGIWIYHHNSLVKGEFFDEVAFNGAASANPGFQVGGVNPYGLYNDAETVLCGPGGGASVAISSINAKISEAYSITMSLAVLTPIPHAYSAGTDSAETVSGVHMGSGAPDAVASSGADNNNQLF